MCGIFGTINYKSAEEEFKRRLNQLDHRGPDGFGIWYNKEGNVKLGHRRLAIIDTDSRSNQPMTFDNRYIIVLNGEIYNYIEIRNDLEKQGVHFQTSSDTEVLLKLMIRKGPDALSSLNGMWSFVMYDDVEKTLFLSRDRIGKKPLYYVKEGDQFAFSSEMKNLVPCLRSFDYNRDFINYSVEHPFDNEILPDTIINGIKKFPAGSWGIYKEGELKIGRFYFPEKLLEAKPGYKNFNEAVEKFKELFESSCSIRMRSDVPVGSALSGGIDSGLIVSTIAKLGVSQKGGYTALVSSFPGSFLDETSDALMVANNAGVDVAKVVVAPDLSPDKIIQSVYDFEEIAVTAPVPFFQTYRGFRDKGIFVTLDGHGGDELFGGYPFDMNAKLKDDFPNIFEMKKTLNNINRMYGNNNKISLKETLPHFKGELLKKISQKKLFRLFEPEQYYRKKLFHSTFLGILPTLLRNYDKYSMHAGVEVRMPFLDYRIIEFAFSLPNAYKVRNGFSKAIVRRAAKGILPEPVLNNKLKSGWNSPMGEWFASVWKQWLLDEISSVDFQNCDLINRDEFKMKVNQFYKNGRYDHGAGQDLWVHLQPYLIEKANRLFL